MSLAYAPAVDTRAIPVVRAGVVAREVCRCGGRGAVATVFERSFYVRIGEEFLCIGEPALANGPTTLIVAARVAQHGVQVNHPAFVSKQRVTIADLLFDLSGCATWRPPAWPVTSFALLATCDVLARHAATDSPPDSLARAVFTADDTPLARAARPRVAAFEEGNLEAGVSGLIGLGPGLTPSGDDFLIGALAMLDALQQTNVHAALARAVLAGLTRTSPLSASFLRGAAAGHIGENLHVMICAVISGDADAAIAAAARIGHTSGWDALAGAVVTFLAIRRGLRSTTDRRGALRGPSAANAPYRC
jgi:uncharacterized protein DUF2877